MPARPPETVLVAITFADDTVGVMAVVTCEYDASGEPRWERLATKENVEEEIRRTFEQDEQRWPIQGWHFVEREDVPDDRTYRLALRHDPEKGFSHDLPHAREIHRDRIRHARELAWPALDAETMKALERGDKAAEKAVAQRKQKLRDAPADPAIDAAETLEQLAEVWPDELRAA